MTSYAIRGGEEGTRRLDLLARVVGPTTEAFLDAAGIGPGMTCLDVGCGAGHVSRVLAARVAPSGRVVGLELDDVKLDRARAEAQRAGLSNMEFRRADVTEWSEPETYDVVYGRFIVSHLIDRPGFVARACRMLRPSGTLLLEDIDFTGCFCHPANSAYDRYCDLYIRVIDRRGGDPNVGPKLLGLCAAAGLEELTVQVVQPAYCGACEEKAISLSTMINIADAVLAEGLATEADVRDVVAELEAFTDDPASIVGCPRIFQVRGHKPA